MTDETAGITIRQDHISVRAKLRNRDEIEWAVRNLTSLRDTMYPAPASFDVVLVRRGENVIHVIKELRSITGLGLKEAKDMSETTNAVVLRGVDGATARATCRLLANQGAVVEMRDSAA